MGYTRPQTFVPGAFLRSCDICGIRYRSSELRRGEDGFWRCVKYCIEIPALTRDKISAESQRRKEAPPPPHGIAFDTKETYAEEEAILAFLRQVPTNRVALPVPFGAPQGSGIQTTPDGTVLPSSAAWQFVAMAEVIRYLAGIVAEAKRPASWLSFATTRITTVADLLYGFIIGIGNNTSLTQANSAVWGAINTGADQLQTHIAASAGNALLSAYQATGQSKYLIAARASASYLRNVQSCGAFCTVNFTSSDAGGAVRLYTGGLISSLTNRVHAMDSTTCMVALEFWKRLYTADGDQAIGCTGTASTFTSAPSQLLSQSIADLRAFIAVGAFDVFSGTTLTGWSATTPREKFNAYPSGTGSWEYADGNAATGTAITGSNIALALRSLYAYEGYSAQVSSIWKWLMGFTSNPAYQCAAGTLAIDYACASTTLAANPPAPPAGQGNTVAPAYDPTLALTTLLIVNGANANQNGSSLYDWSTTGMLAPVQSSQNMSAFRVAKTKMSTPVLRMPVTYSDPASGPVLDWPMLRGVSGLAMQLNFGDSGQAMYWNSISAARCGNAFRYQPQAWTGTNPPQQQPGVTAG